MLDEKTQKQIMNLLDEAKNDGSVYVEDLNELLKNCDKDTKDNIFAMFEDEGIKLIESEEEQDDYVPYDDMESEELANDDIPSDEFEPEEEINEDNDDEMFEEALQDDPEFADLSNEIENDLKTKDIDDIVSSIISPSQADDPIKMYLREIGQIDLLDSVQEVTLSSSVQEGLAADEKLKAFKNGKIQLSDEEVESLNDKVENGYRARDTLIESNLRLVVSIAKRYLGRGMQFQDLIQEGNMGLMKAVNKFDPNKGFKFSTYATWWIKQAITRAIADQARTIRVPVHMVETINKLVRTQRKLTQDLHREPTCEELAAELKISVEKVQQIQKIAQEPVSMETPVGEEDDSSLGDFVCDQDTPNPLDYTINEAYREEINTVLKTLTPREEKVLRLRFGLTDGKPHTLEDVGKEFGVTRERIRQIEAKAIRRLRHPTRQKRLSQYK